MAPRLYPQVFQSLTLRRQHHYVTTLPAIVNNPAPSSFLQTCASELAEAAPLGRSSLPQVVESCLEGVCKPDPRIYQLCLQRLGLQPSEAIFLDDLGQNLKAAANLGIHTIKVT